MLRTACFLAVVCLLSSCSTEPAGPPRATLKSPAPSSTLTTTAATFTWDPVPGATKYWLDVGTFPGKGNISAGELTGTSKTVNVLPNNGSNVYVRLYTFQNGAFQPPFDYALRSCAGCQSLLDRRATLTTPAPGAKLGKTAIFSWTPVMGATKYWLDVGTKLGEGNISRGEQTETSRTVTGLPAGTKIYARLYTYMEGSYLPPLDFSY